MRRVERVPPPDSMIQEYGILLVPVALPLAMLCFGSLNSEWLFFYCFGSFAFSAASFRALKRADGIVKHFARVILGPSACLSPGAAMLRLTGQGRPPAPPHFASLRLNPRRGKLTAQQDAGTIAMADSKQKQKPGPESGYREQHDPRGQPGQDQTRDGKQLPEEADKAKPKPREPEEKERGGD